MAFWDDVSRNVGNFFGGLFGGNNQKKRKDEEEQLNNRVVSSSSPSVTPSSSQPTTQLQVKKPQNMFQGFDANLRLPGSPSTQNAPVKKTKAQELDELTKQNMDEALRESRQGRDFWGAASDFFTGNDKKLAEQNARNKAVNQYQEKNGYNADQEVLKYIGNTRDLGRKTGREIKTQGENLDRFSKGAYKAAEIAQYVPVTGSVMNLGLAASEGLGNKDTREVRNKIDFGMTNAEFDALDDVTKGKLNTIRNIGLAASPLDFTGLGGFAKSGVGGLAKDAVTSLAKRESLDAATRDGLKTLGKNSLRVAAPSAAIGTGISLGAQAYLTGEMDPLEALKSGLVVGGTSMLLPSQNIRKVNKTALNDATNVTPPTPNKIDVRQPRPIDVVETSDEAFDIPVQVQQRETRPIVEVGGDTPGVNQIKVPTAEERFANQPTARPDSRIEGVTRANTGNTGDFTRLEIEAEKVALENALKNGEIDADAFRVANEELSQLRAIDDTPEGAKIKVREVKDIPVVDKTEVQTNLLETPGTVRVTDSTSPNNARSVETAAKQSTTLPPEVQAVLDNPKQFNKRQVASARNQAKLAKQYAKTQEQTAEAMSRIDSASPAAQSSEGFVPTGEFGKSVNGGAYQKVSRATEMQQAIQETANLSPTDIIRTARQTAGENGGGFNRRDIRNIAALFEQKRIQRGTPEWQEARQILKEDGTNWGQAGALRNYTMRRNASADELISRFESKIYRLADDPSKIDGKLFDEVDAAETRFVETRDTAMQAYNRFTENPTSANAKVYHAAQDAAEQADKQAKQTEYKVAASALKGNKDVQQARELEKLAQTADMYQMDAVDASMLSGTGTFVRNFVNSAVGGVEEGLFGRTAARVSSKLTKQDVGGGFGKNSVSGFGDGVKNIVDASKARAGVAGKNPFEHAKNWATTGNQLGDSIIDSQVKNNVSDHYTQLLKGEGYKGRELRDRASVMARQDPNNISELYQQSARVAAGLGSGVTRNNKIETTVKNIISDTISGGNPNKYTENIAKLVTRLTLGFPTAIGRSVAEGGKRFTLGAPSFIKAIATKDPQARALLVKDGIKQAGSGALVIPPVFFALGSSGAITGGYPDDQSERDRWEREGITENSIKIGDDYYQLPAYLGSWAIPGLFYAALGRNGGDFAAAAGDVAKAAPDLLPTGGIDSVLDVVNGRKDIGKYMTQLIPSAIRASTPAGALLNQLAKTFDPTQNDTSSGTMSENIIAKIMSGIPGAANTLENKTDSEGNELLNPDGLSLALGASSTEQQAGIEQTGVLNDQTNSMVQTMADSGAFSDPNLKAIITDEKTKKIYNDIIDGKQATPDDIKKLQDALVKGVSSEGTDTAYLEREQYDTNLTVLNIKRDLMANDPTTKPSSLKDIDTAIKRGEVYRDNEIPYELISAYKSTGVEDWRKMGDPESDEFNEEMYQQLWAIDEIMTQAGVSYAKSKPDKQKFSAKKAGSGRRGGSKSFSADFGTLKAGVGAPSVQQYETIDQRSGSIPVIQKQRPNIVHKIGFSG